MYSLTVIYDLMVSNSQISMDISIEVNSTHPALILESIKYVFLLALALLHWKSLSENNKTKQRIVCHNVFI